MFCKDKSQAGRGAIESLNNLSLTQMRLRTRLYFDWTKSFFKSFLRRNNINKVKSNMNERWTMAAGGRWWSQVPALRINSAGFKWLSKREKRNILNWLYSQ
jgi:hypothetical protein